MATVRRQVDGPRKGDRQPRQDVQEIVRSYDKERADALARRRVEYEAWLRRQKEGDNPPVSPFLLLRYGATDLGARPVPPGTPYWASPDIWVESSDPFGNPVAGEPNYLHARIFNLGAFTAAPVKVDFYWANPALGLGPGDMNIIGTESVQIDPLSSKDVRCNKAWVPTIVNDGHECVMVNCSNWLLDPIRHPFEPTLDRHVGQRNLHVVAGKPGMNVSYRLQINNVFPLELATRITVAFDRLVLTDVGRKHPPRELATLAANFVAAQRNSPLRTASMFRRGTAAHRVAQRVLALSRRDARDEDARPQPFKIVDRGRAATSLSARLSDEYGMIDQRGNAKHAGDLLTALDDFRQDADGQDEGIEIQNLRLAPNAFRNIDVEIGVPSDVVAGEFLVVNLTQRAGPLAIGGYAVIIHIDQ